MDAPRLGCAQPPEGPAGSGPGWVTLSGGLNLYGNPRDSIQGLKSKPARSPPQRDAHSKTTGTPHTLAIGTLQRQGPREKFDDMVRIPEPVQSVLQRTYCDPPHGRHHAFYALRTFSRPRLPNHRLLNWANHVRQMVPTTLQRVTCRLRRFLNLSGLATLPHCQHHPSTSCLTLPGS